MNREIKFRAWDEELNKMFYDGFVVIPTSPSWSATFIRGLNDVDLQKIINEYYRKKGDDLGGDYDLIDWTEFRRLILMQFTGLKDKNNKEIYEGDYVRTITSKTKKLRGGIVVWHGGGFCINYKDEPNTFEWMIYSEVKYEVIGNIYEN